VRLLARHLTSCRPGQETVPRCYVPTRPCLRSTQTPALERIIERAGDVEVTANPIAAPVAIYSILNANGQAINRREAIVLFARMTENEMRRYALPENCHMVELGCVGATLADSQSQENDP
jgi:hypothetical protein